VIIAEDVPLVFGGGLIRKSLHLFNLGLLIGDTEDCCVLG